MATRVDGARIVRDLCRPGGPIERDLTVRAIRVQTRARELCPVDTGRLRSSITWRIDRRGGVPIAVIGTNVSYARYVHDGTGIYGPRNREIVAAPGRVFRFVARDGAVVFTRRIRGVRPRRFLTNALEAA